MPVDAQSHVALYLVKKAQSSERPESLLRTISAALKQFFLAKFGHDPIDSEILRLIQGLIRSNTTRPRERTKIMPVEPFREGFKVCLHKTDNKKVDPVECLLTYLNKTARLTDSDGPVFLTLKQPFRQVESSTVARILNESIRQAGLPPHFTARCFRSTGATKAMHSGADAREVRQLGRWKSEEVFYQHYVYPTSKSSITSSVLNSQLTLF
ncbi:hypothetical protein RRG08_008888 [Elysia crispata]|uniref:Tyr recombinase domain-containing protein n=1 Tax=Elysia crispata TaxID=231223 RepID=A0AAE0ZWU7_9GAST|nr:hypothetical protein RRG08_008888 [Elysia crispata]